MNWEIFNIYKNLLIGFLFLFFISTVFFKKYKSPKYTSEDLKININTADKEKLKSIPYIGEKTAAKILKIRKEKGYFSSIEELKFIRNFEKFSHFIKAQ